MPTTQVQGLIRLSILLPFLFGLTAAQNLLQNGDFEQDLSVGWTATQGGDGTHIIERQTTPQPDPDYEAYLKQESGEGWVRLRQVVDVAGPYLELTFWAQFGFDCPSSCWPVASVCIEYYDDSDAILGETRFYYHDVQCDWTRTSTLNLIDIVDPTWNQYTLDIREEIIDNLPGINAEEVRNLGVALYNYTSGS